MAIAAKIDGFIEKSSWIRKMFEEGARLKARYGAENVFDFSLGNPNLPPPPQFKDALSHTVASLGPGAHAYMPNAGHPEVRQAVAESISREQGVSLSGQEVLMTCGAAGALNVIFKTLLDPGDEVLTPSPYFVEYNFYADNHGGVLKPVPTRDDFTLDLDRLAAAVSPRTKVVLVNSPNNPTGQIYDAASLAALGDLLAEKGRELGRTLYLVADEPYRKVVFDGREVPSVLAAYPHSLVATSYSKDLSIPGERVGYIAVNPEVENKARLLEGLTLANRILGYVNAPALMQRVVGLVQGIGVDAGAYQRKRDLFCDGLGRIGYRFIKPAGAFYLFPRSPLADDVAFVRRLQEEKILAVPGSGFGRPGHFRLAFCVDDQTITGALEGFARVFQNG